MYRDSATEEVKDKDAKGDGHQQINFYHDFDDDSDPDEEHDQDIGDVDREPDFEFDQVLGQLCSFIISLEDASDSSRATTLFSLVSLKLLNNWSEASFLRLTRFLSSLRVEGKSIPVFSDMPKSFDAFLRAVGLRDPIKSFKKSFVCPDEHYIFEDPSITICPHRGCGFDLSRPDPYFPG